MFFQEGAMSSKQDLAFSIVVFFVITGIGASDYLGPNRSTTTYSYERKQCYYTANGTYGGNLYGCHLNLYTTPDGGCPSPSGLFTSSACGWPAGVDCGSMSCSIGGPSESIVGCSSGDQGCRSVGHTTVLPEATVSGDISCSNPGLNGWCLGSATLNINSNEPLAGYNILDVEGTRNGISFACPGSTCSVPLLEGDNSFNFWALSSWGDSSGMGSTSGRVDTVSPLLSGQLSGVTGDGSWFVSTVSATASASDATSGIGSVVYSLDGGPQTAYSGAVSMGDGSHSIVFYAMDQAGNSSSVSLSANVDTAPPAIAVDGPSGTLGAGGWFTSDPTLGASATDGGSGLASMKYSLDGGPQTAYTGAITLGDGVHTVVFTATDQAGNVSTASQTVNVDTIAPHLSLNAGSGFCPACLQKLAIEYSTSDSDSGIAEWAILVDGVSIKNGFSAENATLMWDGSGLGSGAHTVTLWGRDAAGNTNQIQITVVLALPSPVPEDFKIPFLIRTVIIMPATPTAMTTAQQEVGGQSTSTRTAAAPTSTRTNSIIVAMGNPVQGSNAGISISNPVTTNPPIPNAALFGAEAAAVIGAATAFAVDQRRKREEEEAAAAAAAARFNFDQENLEKERAMAAYYRPQFEQLVKGASNIGIPADKLAEYQKLFNEGKFGEAISGLNEYLQTTIKANMPSYEIAALHSDDAKTYLENNIFPYYKPYQDHAHDQLYNYLPDSYREAALHSPEADKWITDNFSKIYQDELNKWAADQLPAMLDAARTLGTPADKMYFYEGFAGNPSPFLLYQLIAANNAELYPIYLAEQMRKLEELQNSGSPISLLPPEYRGAASHSPEAAVWIANNAEALWNAYQELLKKQAANVVDQARANDPILKVINWFDANVIQNIAKLANSTGTAWIVLPALAIAIANIAPWYANIENNPAIFDGVHLAWAQQVDTLEAEHPTMFADAATKRQMFLSNPFEVLSAGSSMLNAVLNTSADYANAIWQQDPIVQFGVAYLQAMAAENCPETLGETWVRRCYSGYYLAAGIIENPFDTAVGIGTSVLLNPIEGIDKAGAYVFQNLFLGGGFKDGGATLTQDPQIQAGAMLLFFIFLAMIFAPAALAVGGVLFGGQTIDSVLAIDKQIQSAANRSDAMQIATSRSTRVFAATTLVVLALLTVGGIDTIKNGVDWYNFGKSLTLDQQATFSDLSIGDQFELVKAANVLHTSPEGIGFLLDEFAKNGSAFRNLPFSAGLKISELAAQSGEETFVNYFLTKYAGDITALSILEDSSPEGLRFYLDQTATPDSPLIGMGEKAGLKVSDLYLDGMDSPQSPLLDLSTSEGLLRVQNIYTQLAETPNALDILGELPLESQAKVLGLTDAPDSIPGTPVLNLSPEEINVLARLSIANPESSEAVLGPYENGIGYTVLGSELQDRYLNMPSVLYEYYSNYPDDFLEINMEYLSILAKENIIIILSKPYDTIMNSIEYANKTIRKEVVYMTDTLHYMVIKGGGTNGNDILIPPK
jgi:hypothetical protein